MPESPSQPALTANSAQRLPIARLLWLLPLALALTELIGHFVIQSRVVEDDDWAAAAAIVREGWQPGDRVVVSPTWAEPLLRQHLGDLQTIAGAAVADPTSFERLWALSIRGHRPAAAPSSGADFIQQKGPVTVLRWALEDPHLLYDFVDHVAEAEVTLVQGGTPTQCPWRTGRPMGGGLGAGPMTPAARHICDPRRPWLWVGATVQDDLSLNARRCLWQHPAGAEPIVTTFHNVPLGQVLSLQGDIYYEHERDLSHGDVRIVVRVDGQEVGTMQHRDGDGWKSMEVSTDTADRGARTHGDVQVEVSATDPHLRSFCWAATTRGEN